MRLVNDVSFGHMHKCSNIVRNVQGFQGYSDISRAEKPVET